MLNHRASQNSHVEQPAMIRPVSPDSEELDMIDDDSWQR